MKKILFIGLDVHAETISTLCKRSEVQPTSRQ